MSLKDKVDFVAGLNDLVKDKISGIERVEYRVFANINHEDWTTEYLVVRYNGGAIQARNCSGNSIAAILDEFSGMTSSSQHNRFGFNDTNDYLSMIARATEPYTDLITAQKILTF